MFLSRLRESFQRLQHKKNKKLTALFKRHLATRVTNLVLPQRRRIWFLCHLRSRPFNTSIWILKGVLKTKRYLRKVGPKRLRKEVRNNFPRYSMMMKSMRNLMGNLIWLIIFRFKMKYWDKYHLHLTKLERWRITSKVQVLLWNQVEQKVKIEHMSYLRLLVLREILIMIQGLICTKRVISPQKV